MNIGYQSYPQWKQWDYWDKNVRLFFAILLKRDRVEVKINRRYTDS